MAASLKADGHSASSVQLDVTSDDSIAGAVSYMEREFGILDVLINNAGIFLDKGAGEDKGLSTRALFHQTFDTNLFGAACLTEACLPLLRKSEVPRVIFVSSRMGSLSEATNKSTMFHNLECKAYDCSKAALNMLALIYARILDGGGGRVNAVCPGLVKTKFTDYTPYGSSPEVGAKRIVELATAAKGGATEGFSDKDGSVPW